MYKDAQVILTGKPHEIYIVSDDKINVGDWFISGATNKILQLGSNESSLKSDKKIIATTDSSLKTKVQHDSDGFLNIPLPQPTQSIIQKYIDEYNKGNVITDVMVEYEELTVPDMIIEGADKFVDALKVNYDRTINIVWAKDESEKDILDFGRYILQLTNNVIKKDTRMKPLDEESGEELLKDLYKQWKERK